MHEYVNAEHVTICTFDTEWTDVTYCVPNVAVLIHGKPLPSLYLNPEPPHVDPSGKWGWELGFVTEGVVDIVWDVTPPQAVNAQPRDIRLGPGAD